MSQPKTTIEKYLLSGALSLISILLAIIAWVAVTAVNVQIEYNKENQKERKEFRSLLYNTNIKDYDQDSKIEILELNDKKQDADIECIKTTIKEGGL